MSKLDFIYSHKDYNELAEAIINHRAISITETFDWIRCPLRGKFKRLDGIEKPKPSILTFGTAIDEYFSAPDDDTRGSIMEYWGDIFDPSEYKQFSTAIDILRPHINTAWVAQKLLWTKIPDLDNHFFYGFADFYGLIDNDNVIIDLKVVREFKPNKDKYWHPQMKSYLWAASCMSLNVSYGAFIVYDVKSQGVIYKTYKPRTYDDIIASIKNALAIRAQDKFPPTYGRHCKWCEYTVECNNSNNSSNRMEQYGFT